MEDDSSPFNTFGKGFKRIFGKGRWTAGEDLTEQEIMSMEMKGMRMVCCRKVKRR